MPVLRNVCVWGLWFLCPSSSPPHQHVPQALAVHPTHHCAPIQVTGQVQVSLGPLPLKRNVVGNCGFCFCLSFLSSPSASSHKHWHWQSILLSWSSTHSSYQVQATSSGVLEVCLNAALPVSWYVNIIMTQICCEYSIIFNASA